VWSDSAIALQRGVGQYFSIEEQIVISFLCFSILYLENFGWKISGKAHRVFKSNNSRKHHPSTSFRKGEENPESIKCHFLGGE